MSLTLNERFSRIAPTRASVPQQVHVSLNGAPRQQLTSGRSVGKPNKKPVVQQRQTTARASVKQSNQLSSTGSRVVRRSATEQRTSSARERAVASRRAAGPTKSNVQQAPIRLPSTPFQLAPQFTQQVAPVFHMGTTAPKQQQQRQGGKQTQKKKQPQQQQQQGQNKTTGKKKAATTNGNGRQAGRVGKAAPAAGRQAQAKAANGAASKKKPAKAKAAPATAANLDADMDTYMAAAPQL